MKEITLTQGKVALVDDEDYERALKLCWRYSNGYAWTGQPADNTRRQLANFIMGDPPTGYLWDHINGDGLDCRKENLRLATLSQNRQNQRKTSKSMSPYKGASFHVRVLKWRAYISKNGIQRHLGFFNTAEEAALAYDHAAKELFGSFAKLNFPSCPTK